ncbi:hypothetical protein [Pseudomonas cichorii]|uniref:hypothetical protein n=1 Tax=Pseudomonas cichorii TaxID=36746 RepID=UPI0021A9DEF3|nr:hypothetical protein [Pseudomonas cichorii]
MNTKHAFNALAGASLLSLTLTAAHAYNFADTSKPFDQYHWVTTHNSYEKINQNLAELPRQLNDGVRGFMLDLYTDNKSGFNRIKVCHKTIACYGPLGNQLKNEFIPFLKNNTSEVVTIFFETYVSRDDMQEVFNAIPELADFSFNPANFDNSGWPTLAAMAQKNNRLIMMTDKREVSGQYRVGSKTITVLFDKDWLTQNKWDTLGAAASNIFAAHNFSCPTRWTDVPLSTQKVASSTGKQWNRLFLMNQFHTVTSTIPDSAKYDNNLTYLMRRATNCGNEPNFIGINNYRNGDAFAYARTLSQGGIYLWEGSDADRKRDTVCAIPSGNRTLLLPTQGCENDEAQSLSLSGVTKGTRITVFDNGGGSREDDYAIIDVKRDIGKKEHVVVPGFEQNRNNADYQIIHVRNNGLNGSISRIEVSRTPGDFSDAAIAFYEGNNLEKNLDCTVPFNRVHNVKMKNNSFGCSNDEFRSARILKAKAGTSFSLVGHPYGDFSQGRTLVTIKRDIKWPVTIRSFNSSYENSDVKVEASKSIDGKISFGYFNGKQ